MHTDEFASRQFLSWKREKMKFKTDKNQTCTKQNQWFESSQVPATICAVEWSGCTNITEGSMDCISKQIHEPETVWAPQARTLRSLHQCEDCTQAGCYCHLWGLPASQHQPLHEGLKTISSLWRVKSVMTCPTQIHSSRTSAKVHKLYTIIHEITSCYLPLIPEWSEKLRWKMPSPAWPTDVGAKQSSAGGTTLQETLSCVFFWVSA